MMPRRPHFLQLFMIKVLFLNIITLLLICSCQNDLEEIDKIINSEMIAVETAKDVSMLYSDSARIKVRIEGPVMLRHLDKSNPRQEFTDGVKVVFFTIGGNVESTLTANYALRLEKKNQIIVRDSVVWESSEGEKLETEELIWEERKEKIYTKRFVKITKPDEVIYGYGFEANQDFTSWTINAVEAELKTKGIDDKNDD
jgi:lipopolysaccharide export system protein LptC